MILEKIKDNLKKIEFVYVFYTKMRAILRSLKFIINKHDHAIEYLKSSLDFCFNKSSNIGLPTTITIEPVNICNINCPVCETGAGKLNRLKRVLPSDDFKRIIDQISTHTNTLIYYFMGEPFLNKKWVEQVQYAKKMGIAKVETSTNGDLANPEDIIASKLDKISFQIGGMTQEIHGIYRVNSQLNKVLDNLEKTIALKKEKNANWLTIDVGFIVMQHNEHQIEEFKNYCNQIGADSSTIVIPVVRNYEEGKKFLPKNKKYWTYDQNEFLKGQLVKSNKIKNYCPWMYYSTVILSNGDVVPCCEDSCGKNIMGNILETNFKQIWNNDQYKNFRSMVNTKQSNLKLCDICNSYGIGSLWKV